MLRRGAIAIDAAAPSAVVANKLLSLVAAIG
jgi:hypothetical protein